MYKVKRFNKDDTVDQSVVYQKEFSTKSGKKIDLEEISRMVKEDIKAHKEAYDILAK